MDSIKPVLDAYPQYIEKLYIRGFLLTDDVVDDSSYPFFSLWNKCDIADKTLLVHPLQKYYVCIKGNLSLALVGHAYNPVAMEPSEEQILSVCSELIERDKHSFWDYFNQLTGVFTFFVFFDDETWIIDDASGMQTTFYTTQNGKMYVSSHTMLVGELLNLQKDAYVERLIRYRFFPLLGNALPGDLTQFVGMKRVTPNFRCVYRDGKFENHRFFAPAQVKDKSMEQLAEETGQLLHNSLELIAQKWDAPAISLTGGCDSKTTLACGNGLYHKYQFYSYSSSKAEQVDCEAAAVICKALGLPHKTYPVAETVSAEEHPEIIAQILRWNCGDLLDSNPNDVRKRIVLNNISDFDVEVKSWASEIGRAYFSKRFHGRTRFPAKPSGRACTTLYKFFLHNRKLVQETDRIFERFIRDYYKPAEDNAIEWFEQFFWEYRVPAWNGLVITGEHRYSSDITIPYNNRMLLTLLLSVPLEDRISDKMYTEIRKHFNPLIDETGVAVTNLLHTDKRARMENLYWTIHTFFRNL